LSRTQADEALGLGNRSPDFEALRGVDTRRYSLASFWNAQLVATTVRAAEDGLIALRSTYAERGVQLLAINSNNPYLSPSDTYAEMVRRGQEKRFNFPYAKDEEGSVARRYGAERTPHVFLLDEERRLRYRGRIADSRDPAKVTRWDLREAVEDLLARRAVEVAETEPFGCAIVW
jgi:AhpC/TSA family